jgi:hypothetical protein
MIRDNIVNSILMTLASDAPAPVRIRKVAALDATDEEKRAAGDMLASSAIDALIAAGSLTPAPTQSAWLLGLTWHQARAAAQRIFLIANGIGWLTDELAARWADPGGTRSLADVLKVLPPERLDCVRGELAVAGISLDEDDGGNDDDEHGGAATDVSVR